MHIYILLDVSCHHGTEAFKPFKVSNIFICVCVYIVYMNQVVSKLKIKCMVYLDKSKKVQSLA